MPKQPFCDNAICPLHDLDIDNNNRTDSCLVEDDRGRREVRRHMYSNADGTRRYYLCDVCHSAVEMTKGPRELGP